jgi:hypothetical protein
MRRIVLSLLAFVVVFGLAMPAQATVIKDVTFSVLPTELGFTEAWASPGTGNAQVNTTTGTWDVVQAAGTGHAVYNYNSLPATLATSATLNGPVVSCEARIDVDTFSGAQDDQTAFAMGHGDASTGYGVGMYFQSGKIVTLTGATAGTATNFAVSNVDGEYHTYGCDLNLSTRMLTVKFDGAQVGSAISAAANWFGEDALYFGDGTYGNAHAETWDRWTLTQTPEPSAVMLLVTGMFGLVCYAWRKRK